MKSGRISRQIGIIGANDSSTSRELNQFAFDLGMMLSELGYTIFCGGMGGVMEAVCHGAKTSVDTFKNQTIGIIPTSDRGDANPYIDIVIPTGIGLARNNVLINCCELFVAMGGGSGTLSELAFAWQKGKTVLCLTEYGGWSEKLAGEELDRVNKGNLVAVATLDEISGFLQRMSS